MPAKLNCATLVSARAYGSLWVVLARELRSHRRSLLVWGLVLFAALLAAVSTTLGTRDLTDRVSAYNELVAQRERDRAHAGGQVSGRVVEPGFRAIRSPEPLSVVVTGLDPRLPDFWDFGPAGRRTGRHYAGSLHSQQRIDLEFIIRVVLGLLAVMLVLDSVGDERSNGMLLALLAQPIRRDVVIAAKLGAGALTLAGSVAMVVGIALFTIQISDAGLITPDFLMAAALLGAAGWLYLVTCFALGALVASAVASYRLVLGATMIIWLLGGVIALPLVQLGARTMSPVPPESLLEPERERLAGDLTEQAQMEMGDEYLEAVPSGEDWTRIDRDPKWRLAVLARLEPIWDRQIKQLTAELDTMRSRASAAAVRQRQIVHWFTAMSPGAQFSAAAMALAGTGYAAAEGWDSATTRYQAELNRRLFHDPPRWTVLVPRNPSDPPTEPRWVVGVSRRDLPTFDMLPHFQPPARSGAGERLAATVPYLAALTAYAFALVTGTCLIFSRIRF